MNGIHYYIIDTETTGLKSGHHEMTELGIIRCSDRVQLHRKIVCEYPERANYDALKITGKTLADLSQGHLKEKVVEEAMKFFEEDKQSPAGRCIVAHNTPFDRKFLHALWSSCGKEFPAHLWLDTITMTQDFIKKADTTQLKIVKTATGRVSTTLHAACDMVGIKKISQAHNAKVDSRNTYLLWKNLMEEKKIDHLPFIKTFIHDIGPSQKDVDDLLEELNSSD